jgi:hypothetical protein
MTMKTPDIVRGILGGLLVGLGGLVLLQQFGVVYPTTVAVLVAIVLGVAAGVGARALLAQSRGGTPADPAPMAATPGWAPTHVVPRGGMRVWERPDPSAPPLTRLAGGLEVQVREESGGWTRIGCANGWSGWVDGRQLRARRGRS